MPKITVIPARLDQATFMPLDQPVKRKVAGYARVSTDSDEQKTSYEAQVRYYTNYIKSRDDWEFVNVYTDAFTTDRIQTNIRSTAEKYAELRHFRWLTLIFILSFVVNTTDSQHITFR